MDNMSTTVLPNLAFNAPSRTNKTKACVRDRSLAKNVLYVSTGQEYVQYKSEHDRNPLDLAIRFRQRG